jgi:type II secretory pathway pseudopilin PulG
MNYCSNKILLSASGEKADSCSIRRTGKLNAKRRMLCARPAFTLAEAVAALVILAFASTSVLVVINRYMASAADSVLHMQAFEVARQNMEALLTSDTVEESVESGYSEKYPDIEWQTVVETFYEPLTSRMWIQAVCSAEYFDSDDEVQTVELTHWLTDVTKSQLLKLLEQRQDELDQSADQIIESLTEAAEYAGVDEQTLQQWIDNGMLTTEDGFFTKNELDLYRSSGGNPTPEDRLRHAESIANSLTPTGERAKQGEQRKSDAQRRTDGSRRAGSPPGTKEPRGPRTTDTPKPRKEIIPGYTWEELENLPPEKLFPLFFGNR